MTEVTGRPEIRSGERRRPAPLRYTPALDGLRGIAILLVLAYHAFPAVLHGGFLGVELFFVLSGFLITSLLVQEWDDYGGICLPYFYMRRVLRLLPALVLLLVCITLVDWLVFDAGRTHQPLRDAGLSFAYVMNWARAGGWVEQSFLGHTWSLSIEEQFYLLWPLLIGLLCRSGPRSEWGRRLLVMAGIVAIYRCALLMNGATALRLYNGLDTRADGLILGSALAAVLRTSTSDATSAAVVQRFRTDWPWAISVCAGAILVAVLRADWRLPTTYTLWLPLTAVSSTGLIAGVVLARPESWLRRGLEGRWLVGTGRISYGLYLWHYPIYRMLGRLGFDELTTAVIGTAASLTVACASYRYVEQPILQLKGRYSPQAAWSKRGTVSATVDGVA